MLQRNKNWKLPTSQLPTKVREKQVAKRLQGKQVAGSGATPWAKQDVKTDQWLVQHKQTGKSSHAIKREDLEQLRKDALHEGKFPVYMVEFDDGGTYYVIGQAEYADLEEYYRRGL